MSNISLNFFLNLVPSCCGERLTAPPKLGCIQLASKHAFEMDSVGLENCLAKNHLRWVTFYRAFLNICEMFSDHTAKLGLTMADEFLY